MVDLATGTIRFADPAAEIPASLTRSAFLASPLADGARVSVKNEPWCSWNLGAEYVDQGHRFAVTIYFEGERLDMISIADVNPAFGTSWQDMTDEKERQRHAAHEQWLSRSLGSARRFAWGSVSCGRDHWGNPDGITVTYPKPHPGHASAS